MNLRMPNIAFGFTVLFLSAVVGGMALGGTFDANSVKEGYHMLSIARFYLRDGHSHGNFICFYNLFVGIILNHLALSARARTICSYGAMVGILLPVGLAAKGAAGAPVDFPPIGIIGIAGIALSLLILIYGSFRGRALSAG